MKTTRYSFRPGDFQSTDSSTKAAKTAPKFIRKGSHDMNTEKVDKMLRILKEHQNEYIKDLSGEVKKVWTDFTHLVRTLKGSEAYNTFYNMVKGAFYHNKSYPIPGTIYAYMTSCMIKSGPNENPGCSILCAEGLQPPEKYNFKCDHRVILAKLSDHGYSFQIVQDANSDKGIIYIDGLSNSKDFLGFTDSECRQIEQLGVLDVYIRGVSKTTGKNINVTNDFIKCEDVKRRIDTKPNSTEFNPNSALIIVLIVVILIILFISWRMFASNTNISL